MCTYDYTPYTGCEAGEQHYYIQWVKCTKAVENGRYCSLQKSTEVEQLRKLSTNVLSCPLHGPVAVQQYILDAANPLPREDGRERTRARSTTRRDKPTSRGRTPARGSSDRDLERPLRRGSHRRRIAREAAESSDSESSQQARQNEQRSAEMRRRQIARENPHRRSLSADVVLLPPPALTVPYGRSDASLPLKAEPNPHTEKLQATTTSSPPTRPNASLDIPRAPGVIGLPSRPDMHRRASVHRSRSDGVLRQGIAGELESSNPPAPTTTSPSSDNSPDHNPELPFSTPGRRGRRSATRSIRDHSVDTVMRRIDEHVVSGGNHENPGRDAAPGERRGSAATSPEPPHNFSHPRKETSRPRLNSLQIPKPSEHYQRDAYSAPTATPPETDITSDLPLRSRTKSVRHNGILSAPPLSPPPSLPSHRNDDTASIRSSRSRRFEDQVADGRKWVVAREHMPLSTVAASPRGPMTDVLAHMSSPNLALGITNNVPLAARESVDSGYRSGHQVQRSWETIASESGSVRGAKGGRNLLQKAQPQQAQQAHQQQSPAQGPERQYTPIPAPLDLRGLPPCALPVSLLSPSFQPDLASVSSGAKGDKVSLLQRLGLRKKMSGRFWGGGREVGAVEG
ncbi:hypothetical protein VTI74DRAFT_11552 [Chaetomium olivicolor]